MLKTPASIASNESEPEPEATESKDALTLALVDRVSDRVAKGIPLRLAAAREGLTPAEYEERLKEHPKLALRQDAAICDFTEFCIRKLLDVDDPSSNIRWLLERNNLAMFTKPKAAENEPVAEKKPTILGMTEEELHEFREGAKLL